MQNIIIKLLDNKRTLQTTDNQVQIDAPNGYIVVAGENNSTIFAVEYSEKWGGFRFRIDMVNSMSQKYPTFDLEEAKNIFPELNLKDNEFPLPIQMTVAGYTHITISAGNDETEEISVWEKIAIPVQSTNPQWIQPAPEIGWGGKDGKSGNPGGITDKHDEFQNLDYEHSGHTGFAPIDNPNFTGIAMVEGNEILTEDSKATATNLGGIKANPATSEDVQEVHVNADGFPVTKPNSNFTYDILFDGTLNTSSAEQHIGGTYDIRNYQFLMAIYNSIDGGDNAVTTLIIPPILGTYNCVCVTKDGTAFRVGGLYAQSYTSIRFRQTPYTTPGLQFKKLIGYKNSIQK